MTQPTEIRRARAGAIIALILSCAAIPAVAAQSSDTIQKPAAKSSTTTHSTKRSSKKRKPTRLKGQQKIDSYRATEIQEALIREHYLDGTASGAWNQASEDAMRRYQADHGWQTKEVPDSRAIIKLGLGPSKDRLLNPESAMTTGPDAPRAQAVAPTSHSASPESSPASTSTQSDPTPQ